MRRIKGTVATIADLADELEVQAPATIIFGECHSLLAAASEA